MRQIAHCLYFTGCVHIQFMTLCSLLCGIAKWSGHGENLSELLGMRQPRLEGWVREAPSGNVQAAQPQN